MDQTQELMADSRWLMAQTQELMADPSTLLRVSPTRLSSSQAEQGRGTDGRWQMADGVGCPLPEC